MVMNYFIGKGEPNMAKKAKVWGKKKVEKKAVETKPEPVNLPTPKVDPESLLAGPDLKALKQSQERTRKIGERKGKALDARYSPKA